MTDALNELESLLATPARDWTDTLRASWKRLADYVRVHPGELEARLLEWRGSALALFWGQMAPWEHLPSFSSAPLYRALEPSAMLRLFEHLVSECFSGFSDLERQRAVDLAGFFANRCGERAGDVVGGLELAPELRDTLVAHATGEPPGNILPEDVAEMSVPEIEEFLVAYCGVTIRVLEERMQPGAWASCGFLAPGERLAEVILRDARELVSLGVTRHAIADRIELVLDVSWHNLDVATGRLQGAELGGRVLQRRQRIVSRIGEPTLPDGRFELPWQTPTILSAGYQKDPFYTSSVRARYDSSDFFIAGYATPEVLHGPGLIIDLIRRACFFEGAVRYRVEPARVVELLSSPSLPLR